MTTLSIQPKTYEIHDLPNEVLQNKILACLPITALVNCGKVCRLWKEMALLILVQQQMPMDPDAAEGLGESPKVILERKWQKLLNKHVISRQQLLDEMERINVIPNRYYSLDVRTFSGMNDRITHFHAQILLRWQEAGEPSATEFPDLGFDYMGRDSLEVILDEEGNEDSHIMAHLSGGNYPGWNGRKLIVDKRGSFGGSPLLNSHEIMEVLSEKVEIIFRENLRLLSEEVEQGRKDRAAALAFVVSVAAIGVELLFKLLFK